MDHWTDQKTADSMVIQKGSLMAPQIVRRMENLKERWILMVSDVDGLKDDGKADGSLEGIIVKPSEGRVMGGSSKGRLEDGSTDGRLDDLLVILSVRLNCLSLILVVSSKNTFPFSAFILYTFHMRLNKGNR